MWTRVCGGVEAKSEVTLGRFPKLSKAEIPHQPRGCGVARIKLTDQA